MVVRIEFTIAFEFQNQDRWVQIEKLKSEGLNLKNLTIRFEYTIALEFKNYGQWVQILKILITIRLD